MDALVIDRVAAERSRQWHLAIHGRDLTLCGRIVRRRRGSPLGPGASVCQLCRFNNKGKQATPRKGVIDEA